MFIGKNITVTDAKNKSIQGVKGLVVDETKHTLVIQTNTTKQKTNITILKEQIITIEETP